MKPQLVAALLSLAVALPARAHHGVASVAFAGPEGPGAAHETTSALPLPQGTVFAMAKSEYVRFRSFSFAAPENKAYSSFSTLGVGYGVTPWLSAFVFQPFGVKAQDTLGRDAGLGDPSVMLAVAFKWDEGLRLVPEKESLDELLDWHFSAWIASTLPLGATGVRDDLGAAFAPDMQPGFGAPSPSAGVAVLKQVATDLTVLAEASHQRFFAHTYDLPRGEQDQAARTRYRFGAETRVNGAVVWRAWAGERMRLDLAGELNGLHLQRDRERNADGAMEPLRASGGAILYAGAGARLSVGAFGAALGIRRAALTDLNERGDQQGSEGLEAFRAALTLSWSTGF
jgi:hypothetical protein